MGERLRQRLASPARRGLIERARLLLEQRQIMTWLENKVVAGIAARMTSDLDTVAENDHLVDEAFASTSRKPYFVGTE